MGGSKEEIFGNTTTFVKEEHNHDEIWPRERKKCASEGIGTYSVIAVPQYEEDICRDGQWSKGGPRYNWDVPKTIVVKQNTTTGHQGDTR